MPLILFLLAWLGRPWVRGVFGLAILSLMLALWLVPHSWHSDHARRQGMAFAAEGRLTQALDMLDRAIAWDPDSQPARRDRATLLARAGYPELAIIDLSALIDQADSEQYRLERAEMFLASDRPADALADLQAVKKPADRLQWLILSGRALSWLGQHELAIERLQEAVDLEPSQARLPWATALLTAGQAQQAEEAFSQILKSSPENRPALLGRARAWLALGQPGRALEDTAAYRGIWSLEPDVWQVQALASMAIGDFEAAAKGIEQALSFGSRDVENLRIQGQIEQARGHYQQAESRLKEALGWTGTDKPEERAEVLVDLGQLALEMGQAGQALDWFDSAIALNPESAAAWGGRGETRLRNRLFPAAVDDLSEAIRLQPEEARWFALRAEAYRGWEHIDEADADLLRAAELEAERRS
jgi:tetratricopeptide (TPR) repeat protein